MSSAIERAWYSDNWLAKLLIPLSYLFAAIAARRRIKLQREAVKVRLAAPVVVVGNISVGGTGKTPLLIAMVKEFQARGFKPGVISRGYGGKPPYYPFAVESETAADIGGDEPVLIAQQAGCPVVVDANRLQAAQFLLSNFDCDLVLSDDGMQHYALPRDIEIAVIDGVRGFGNGRLLPAGPLREPQSRLAETDFVVVNSGIARPDHKHSYVMQIVADNKLRPLLGGAEIAIQEWEFSQRQINAVAGIGNPQRFANTLTALGFEVELHAFPDHHQFTASELQFDDNKPVIMTAKDAVKCRSIATAKDWVLDVNAQLPEKFWDALSQAVNEVRTKNQVS